MSDKGLAKVLVVDDAAFMRVVLRDILTSSGYQQIYEAGDGTAALDAYQLYRPDITMMDINMPGTDGIQALRSILQINPMAKVVMVTSVEQKHIVEEAIRLGARDYIVKPFERGMVATVIGRVLRSR
ncbi:MAG: response regulator [Nitrososphaera sp.]|nr:response regulator [Nitrososphaera sp.]